MHWVFAYGSNMHLPDLRRWLKQRDAEHVAPMCVAPARMVDIALTWDYHSESRQGGAANATARTGEELRGLLLGVDDELLALLDRKEGHPARYDRGQRPLAAQRLDTGDWVEAWLYRVTPSRRSAAEVPPRAAYLRLLVEAAVRHRLGGEYVKRLRAVRTEG